MPHSAPPAISRRDANFPSGSERQGFPWDKGEVAEFSCAALLARSPALPDGCASSPSEGRRRQQGRPQRRVQPRASGGRRGGAGGVGPSPPRAPWLRDASARKKEENLRARAGLGDGRLSLSRLLLLSREDGLPAASELHEKREYSNNEYDEQEALRLPPPIVVIIVIVAIREIQHTSNNRNNSIASTAITSTTSKKLYIRRMYQITVSDMIRYDMI